MKNIHFTDKDYEIWKVIEHPKIIRPNSYAINNLGKIKNISTGYILRPYLNKQTGYYEVKLPILIFDDNSMKYKNRNFTIHSLVHYQFTNEPYKIYDKRYIINHKDGIKTNCESYNLEWVTIKENNEHAAKMGLIKTCEDANNAKIDNETVHKICKLLERNISYRGIMNELNMNNTRYNKNLLIRIRTGKQWKNISSQYKIDTSSRLRKHSDEYVDNICNMIEKGYSNKWIYNKVVTNYSFKDFSKFVNFIRDRKCYKDISDKYKWWREFNE